MTSIRIRAIPYAAAIADPPSGIVLWAYAGASEGDAWITGPTLDTVIEHVISSARDKDETILDSTIFITGYTETRRSHLFNYPQLAYAAIVNVYVPQWIAQHKAREGTMQ